MTTNESNDEGAGAAGPVSGHTDGSSDPAGGAGNGHHSNTTAARDTSEVQPAATTASNTSARPPNRSPRIAATAANPPSALQSLAVSATQSTGSSPLSSREQSPARQARGIYGMTAPNPHVRSRKNSSDASPNRNPTVTVPSAAAIQRALSSANTSQPPSTATSPETSRLPRPQRSAGSSATETSAPQWPVSPRLKSPPPSNSGSRRNSLLDQRKPAAGPSAPNIVVQRASPASSSPATSSGNDGPAAGADEHAPTHAKGIGRGHGGAPPTLETVQEASLPNTPFGTVTGQSGQGGKYFSKVATEPRPEAVDDASRDETSEKGTKVTESGSDSSGGNKSDDRNKRQPPTVTTTRAKLAPTGSYTSLNAPKTRSGNENMTVETETVSSIPQAALTSGGGERSAGTRNETGGTIRLKPSTETIRPKKERKKATARKAASINSGTASSKADVFEAKVASAVGEANSSDSDETFVYESNPPEPPSRPSRHHSRTPSATSMQSLLEHRSGVRSMNTVLDAHRGVAGKRSMKFANNPYHGSGAENDGGDRLEGTGRAGHSRSGTSGYHQHQGSRHGWSGAHGAHLDAEAPAQHLKTRGLLGGISRHSSRPTSPRLGSPRAAGMNKNGEISTYDMDGEGADDERTPLVGTVRTTRSRAPRRPNSASLRQLEHYERRRRGWVSQCAGCVVLVVLLLLLIFGVLGFIFASTKPLYDVRVQEIQNVLASEQEIMLDLLVQATNPNIIAVNVEKMDLNIFAKSKHVGSEKWWREHGPAPPSDLQDQPHRRRHHRKGGLGANSVDEGTDPISDPKTMLLGRIFHFDSGLNFEGSPVKRRPHFSSGELRLQHPGNKTEAGGSERWERVIMHPFELIVRGILKYQLPLTNNRITTPVGASVLVHPEEGVDGAGKMRVEQLAWMGDEFGEPWLVVDGDENTET